MSRPGERESGASGDAPKAGPSFTQVAEVAVARLARNQRVRRNLPGDGRLRMDRQLPFLCVYREPTEHRDVGTVELVTTEAAYCFASGAEEYRQGLEHLCQAIAAAMLEHFGTFLLIEVWADEEVGREAASDHRPAFDIVSSQFDAIPSTIAVLREALEGVELRGFPGHVAERSEADCHPPGLPALRGLGEEGELAGCCHLGLAVKPVYRQQDGRVFFPMILQSLRWQLADAIRRAVAEFTGLEDEDEGDFHYHSYGPSTMVQAARDVDQQLSEVADAFDFLLQVTPTNSDEAWSEFRASKYRTKPVFHYRPLPYHPSLIKRKLYEIEIERVEDPTLAFLFWQKQEEIDRQLTALRDLDSANFLYGSLQLYGYADSGLVRLASRILECVPARRAGGSSEGRLDSQAVVQYAEQEIRRYQKRFEAFTPSVELCDSIASGIMVSQDRLLISENVAISTERMEPLLHHEIGTHLLTYFNGKIQPLYLLHAGLAGYEELQEGLAVLAEYLCGGLTARRLRSLAGRVVASHSMVEGAPFAETFDLLRREFAFSAKAAFTTATRAYRGGGFTKDIIYLRGLQQLLEFLAAGHDVEPLYVGKVGLQHVPFLQEMRRRGVIQPPGALPRLWSESHVRDKLEACRGLDVLQLLENPV